MIKPPILKVTYDEDTISIVYDSDALNILFDEKQGTFEITHLKENSKFFYAIDRFFGSWDMFINQSVVDKDFLSFLQSKANEYGLQ